MAENSNRASRTEIIFVISLLIIGIGALTATLLHANGIWFNDSSARIVYRIFWVFAWLPGMAMAFMLLLRGKSILSMALSMLLQAAALVLYQISPQLINLACAFGFLGLGMPWLLSLTRLELKKQCLELLVFLGLLLLVFFDKDGDAWGAAAIPLVFFWAGYGASIWPGVDAILKQLLEQEKPQREKSRLALWFDRILIALAIVAMLFVVVILIISHHYRFFIQEHLLP